MYKWLFACVLLTWVVLNEVAAQTTCNLNATAQVLAQAKCGRATGRAQIRVTGGSGNYTYSLAGAPNLTGLAAGAYTVTVTDQANANCRDTAQFTIAAVQPFANVRITPYSIVCQGRGQGFVSFEVTPGSNFAMPFSFSLQNSAGTEVKPDKLPAGLYRLQILDADGCALPFSDTFRIREPARIRTQASITAESCTAGGRIALNITGGNGDYKVDWADLPGFFNAPNRQNLTPGVYKAVIYDRLFCTDTIGPYTVGSNCTRRDTGILAVLTNKTATYCLKNPNGIDPAQVQYSLLGRSALGQSSFGRWNLNSAGCLQYIAGSRVRFGADTVCIVQRITPLSLADTLCLIVHITRTEPTQEYVSLVTQSGRSARGCGTIPTGYANLLVRQQERSGLSGRSSYGTYTIDANTGCLTFSAFDQIGYNLDTICVVVSDRTQVRTHIICYVPTVLPTTVCETVRPLSDVSISTENCGGFEPVCIPIPFNDIISYVIFDNGAPYNNGFSGCSPDSIITYNAFDIPAGGPYTLSEWRINGRNFSGPFTDINGLLTLMNVLDPTPGWKLEENQRIVGGNPGRNRYGPLRISAASGLRADLPANIRYVPQGTQLRFPPGNHEVVLRRIPNGCADTMRVKIDCSNCPAIHNAVPDAEGLIKWRVNNCNNDTLFCTSIPRIVGEQFQFTDNGVLIPSRNYGACGAFLALRLDTGFHQIRVRNILNPCTYAIRVDVGCPEQIGDVDALIFGEGERQSICLDTGLIDGPIVRFQSFCPGNNGVVSWSLNQRTRCIEVAGVRVGRDTLCARVCNRFGDCFNYQLEIEVRKTPDTTTVANPDFIVVQSNKGIEIPILSNDIIRGSKATTDGVSAIAIIERPRLGTAVYNTARGAITYTSGAGNCGTDQLVYRLQDKRGKADTALVTVVLQCAKPQIFTGFSPNNDGVNDTWVIRGLDQFPKHRIKVFNRWGTLVFEAANYMESNAWDGQWNERALPDGTYFYLIDLGDGSAPLSGNIQLMR
jgi:gliding motility-associated-like protein